MMVLLLHSVFTFLRILRTYPRAPPYVDNWNAAPLQALDLKVYDFDRFSNGVECVVDLDFIQRYGKCFVGHEFLQVRDVKSTVNSAQLVWEFKSIGDGSQIQRES
ncbi:hypothetical protein Tco_1580811 [Tanacetum coccineum]